MVSMARRVGGPAFRGCSIPRPWGDPLPPACVDVEQVVLDLSASSAPHGEQKRDQPHFGWKQTAQRSVLPTK